MNMITCIECSGKMIQDDSEYICNDCGRVVSFTKPPVQEDLDGDMV